MLSTPMVLSKPERSFEEKVFSLWNILHTNPAFQIKLKLLRTYLLNIFNSPDKKNLLDQLNHLSSLNVLTKSDLEDIIKDIKNNAIELKKLIETEYNNSLQDFFTTLDSHKPPLPKEALHREIKMEASMTSFEKKILGTQVFNAEFKAFSDAITSGKKYQSAHELSEGHEFYDQLEKAIVESHLPFDSRQNLLASLETNRCLLTYRKYNLLCLEGRKIDKTKEPNKAIAFFIQVMTQINESHLSNLNKNRLLASATGSIGATHYVHNRFNEAIEYYERTLVHEREGKGVINNAYKTTLSTSYLKKAELLKTAGDFKGAIRCYDQAIEYKVTAGVELTLQESNNHLRQTSLCFAELGESYLKNDLPEATSHLLEACERRKKMVNSIDSDWRLIAYWLVLLKSHTKADDVVWDYNNKILFANKFILALLPLDRRRAAIAHSELGTYFIKQTKWEDALKHFQASSQFYTELVGITPEVAPHLKYVNTNKELCIKNLKPIAVPATTIGLGVFKPAPSAQAQSTAMDMKYP